MSITSTSPARTSGARPFLWIPSLYFAEGVPYMVVASVSVVMLKDLGMKNDALAFWTSWLMLPWILKPFWTPLVDLHSTKRRWIVGCQFGMAALFGLAAFVLPLSFATQAVLGVFLLLAFLSATHDASADGFYMLALDSHSQALYSGVRSVFYRVAAIVAQGGLVMLAGFLEKHTGNASVSWSFCMTLTCGVFALLGLYHLLVLPKPEDVNAPRPEVNASLAVGILDAFLSFFKKPGVWSVLAFLLFYRFAESQLLKLFAPFMLDSRAVGGLGMSVGEQGFIYGTLGVLCLLAGGIIGGIAVARGGLGRWLLPMCLAMNVPDLLFIYLSQVQPEGLLPVAACVSLEQFGYGFGFTAFMLVMVQFAEDSGIYKTSHYAIMTGFMALGMMAPGLFAGKLQMTLGYKSFFLWVLLCVVPSVVVTLLAGRIIRKDFGLAGK